MSLFYFDPKADITAYELALVLKQAQLAFSAGLLETLPANLGRHFTPEKEPSIEQSQAEENKYVFATSAYPWPCVRT